MIRTQGNNVDCINKIGGWRMSTYADIQLPNELYQVVENIIVEIPTSILLLPKKIESISIILMNLLPKWRN